jgi:PAS domain S-box-containing protein
VAPRAALAVPIGLLCWLCLAFARQAERQALTAAALQQHLADRDVRLDAAAADLRDAEGRARSIVDSAIDGMVGTDERGTIESVNPAAVRLLGYSSAQVIGRPLGLLVRLPGHEDDEAYIQRQLPQWNRPAAARRAAVVRMAVWFRCSCRCARSSRRPGQRIVSLHDLTESVGLAQRLRASEARGDPSSSPPWMASS